jgi:uncharacterized membrane protein YgcG
MRTLLILGFLTSPILAAIEDGAKLFSAEAVTAAEKKLEDIKRLTHKEIIIITTPDLQGKPIYQTAVDIALARRLNGAVIIISTKPRQLDVVAGRRTALVLTYDHEKKVRDILTQNLRRRPNDALHLAVDYLHNLFKNANAALIQEDQHRAQAPAAEQATSSSGGWLKWLIIAVVILLAIRALSYFLGRRAEQVGAMPAPGAGGGFFPSLMGGLFGAFAGHWIYDKFFSNHDNYSHGSGDHQAHDTSWRDNDDGELGPGAGGDWGDNGDDSGGDSGGSEW